MKVIATVSVLALTSIAAYSAFTPSDCALCTVMTSVFDKPAQANLALLNENESEYPAEWFLSNRERDYDLYDLEGNPAPNFMFEDVDSWYGDALKDEDLEGKIVVVDIWTTWCGPCRAALPHNEKIHTNNEDVVVIGLCMGSDEGQMNEILEDKGVTYSNAYVESTADAYKELWKHSFYPTYVVIDPDGVVRAAGLNGGGVDGVIASLQEEFAEDAQQQTMVKSVDTVAIVEKIELPEEYIEGNDKAREIEQEFADGDAPSWDFLTDSWVNSEALNLEDLEGKVVVLDFWATWCGPCLASVPHNKEMIERFGDDLVFIAVCHENGSDSLSEVMEEHGIDYSVVVDNDGATGVSYGVNGYPDYAIIDQSGDLVCADVKNSQVENAIAFLLGEETE